MISPKFMENAKKYLFGKYSKGLGQMLLITGTLGWILSAAGQLCGIMTNKKLSGDQKKFLIPQEAADAAVNILSFYLVTKSIKDISRYFVSSGRVVTKEIGKFCKDHKILTKTAENIADFAKSETQPNWVKNIGQNISSQIADINSTLKVADAEKIAIDPIKKQKLLEDKQKLQTFLDDKYSPFESGAETLGSIVGAILSSNIITPIIRNPIAAAKQKQAIALEKIKEQENQQAVLLADKPVLPAYNKPDNDNRVKLASVNPAPRITTGGGMKI